MEQAINKIRMEMDANPNNSYIQIVGRFLLEHIQTHPADAEKICNSQKTISNSLDEMKKAAEKKKIGNCAVLTDQEGFVIVLEYFEIERQAAASTIKPVAMPDHTDEAFDVKLEDLL